jgi:hypothetical protein
MDFLSDLAYEALIPVLDEDHGLMNPFHVSMILYGKGEHQIDGCT